MNGYKLIPVSKPASSDTSVLVLYTGGTIGMDYDRQTGSLVPMDFGHILDEVPELRRFDFRITVLAFDDLVDSSNIKISHWIQIAKAIEAFYDQYDGFVILHGTDTMSFSASALSYMLENLHKPVIFTGAQLPINATRTDARENLLSALEIAAAKENGRAIVPEVCIFFDNVLLRGNRSRKFQNFNFAAFSSSNYPPLAVAGIHIDYNRNLIARHPQKNLVVRTTMNTDVVILKLFPNMTESYVEAILSIPTLKGVVMETYGSGNTPTDDWFVECLRRAVRRQIIILNVTQCAGGRVLQGRYATSVHLTEIGVIGGGDMTTEAAVTKLMFLLSHEQPLGRIKKLLSMPLRGEMSGKES